MTRKPAASRRGSVRIIGGKWRGRRVPVAAAGVRPTPDRVRETLFNWLDPVIQGAACLDLFAGTGVLGLEALSRGAAEACFVEREGPAAGLLADLLERLGVGEHAWIIRADALRFLQGPPRGFDVVFVDPPFGGMDLRILCTLLERGWLSRGASIYLEVGRQHSLPTLPADWSLLKERTAGQVRFGLARYQR